MNYNQKMSVSNENKLLHAFQELVALKYQLYNALFLSLPFAHLKEVGIELPVFNELCHKELQQDRAPQYIINHFFSEMVNTSNCKKEVDIIFLILQFVERQIVLFDALEDAAFSATHVMDGPGSLRQLLDQALAENKLADVCNLLQTYRTRIVLTAHPTQFYPPQILSIINDLIKAVRQNNTEEIHNLLLQMGMTSFRREQKPTPLDEAETIIQYLERVFYPVIKNIHYKLFQSLLPFL